MNRVKKDKSRLVAFDFETREEQKGPGIEHRPLSSSCVYSRYTFSPLFSVAGQLCRCLTAVAISIRGHSAVHS
jgi:hypothetical protein